MTEKGYNPRSNIQVIIIDPKHRTVTLESVRGGEHKLTDLQGLVGGWLERGHAFQNGDDLLVNEEGMLAQPRDFFTFPGAKAAFAGVGVIVGTVSVEGGKDWTDPKTSPADVLATVEFLTRDQLQRQVRAAGGQ